MYIIHYWELALKWKNRNTFEKKLIQNINKKLKLINNEIKIKKRYWKYVIYSEEPKIQNILSKTPGISYFAKAKKAKLDMIDIAQKAIEIFPKNCKNFKVETTRTNKNFPLKSPEISRIIWAEIVKQFDKKVDLHNPEITLHINIAETETYLYTQKIPWIGGLPVGSSGHAVSLLSWGIDSPVSSFLLIKRWCKVTFVHAYNKTLEQEKVKEKILKLKTKLDEIQWDSKIYFLPYETIQKEIIQWSQEKYRMLLFKRSIVRIANQIANKTQWQAIILWDSLWQVASQTMENIQCIYSASKLPIFSPLLGYDKQEIINIAKKIWTYEISILPHNDCCSLIATNNPQTKWKTEVLQKLEDEIMITIPEEKIISQLNLNTKK